MKTKNKREKIPSPNNSTIIGWIFAILTMIFFIVILVLVVEVYKKDNEILKEINSNIITKPNSILIASGDSTTSGIDMLKNFLNITRNLDIINQVKMRYCDGDVNLTKMKINMKRKTICDDIQKLYLNREIIDEYTDITYITTSSENAIKLSLESDVVKTSVTGTMLTDDFIKKICSQTIIDNIILLYIGDMTNCIVTNLELTSSPDIDDIITSIKNDSVFLNKKFYSNQHNSEDLKFITPIDDSDSFTNMKNFLEYHNDNNILSDNYVTYTTMNNQDILENIAKRPQSPQVTVVSLSELNHFYSSTNYVLNEIKLNSVSCFSKLDHVSNNTQILSPIYFFHNNEVASTDKVSDLMQSLLLIYIADVLENLNNSTNPLSINYLNKNIVNNYLDSNFMEFWCSSQSTK